MHTPLAGFLIQRGHLQQPLDLAKREEGGGDRERGRERERETNNPEKWVNRKLIEARKQIEP